MLAEGARAIAQALAWAPLWLITLALIALAFVGARLAHWALSAFARRLLRSRDKFWRSLVERTRGPTRLALIVLFVGAAIPVAPITDGQASLAARILSFVFVLLVGWMVLTALDIWAALYLRKFRLDVEDNLLARKHITQVRILRRVANVVVIILSFALALMTVPGVRQYGVSLLASAGAAGIILGLALQPILTNLVAGIQIAMTQPIRLDDAVIVEGEWGNIEEITSTYVVVRLWDWRRMVLPLSYFIQKPFQNWTRETSRLIGTAFLYVDYAAPIDRLRAKLQEIVEASPLWDREVVALQVTDATERTLQVRCLASARNAGSAFDLRCDIREQMVAFIRQEMPEALPQDRLSLEGPTSDAGPSPSRKTAENRPSG